MRRRTRIRTVLRTALAGLAVLGLASWAWARRPLDRHTVVRTLEVGGRERSFRLHVPPDLARATPAPLILAFHGGGSDGRATERLTGFSAISDRDACVVVYPDAVGHNWNDGRDASVSAAHADHVDDVAFVAAILDAVNREQAIDSARVFATGISNGAIFSHYLAARLSPRIAAIAPVVGGLADPFCREFAPQRPVSVLVLQGTDDPLVPYDGGAIAKGRGRIVSTGEAIARWGRCDGCRSEATEDELPDRDPEDGCRIKRSVWTGGREGTEVVLYRIEGGGHTWPGGAQYLPEGFIGRVCRDIDGSEVIWRFFQDHPRQGP